MALQKSKTLPNGSTGDYWKVAQVIVDKKAMVLVCTISLFMNQTVADVVGPQTLGVSKYYTFPVTKDQLAGDIVALAYTLIIAKVNSTPTDPDLAGSTNV